MDRVMQLWRRLVGFAGERQAMRGVGSEAGQAVNEWLGLSALGIVAIVAIGAALKALGVDIVDWMRTQLGM